MENVPDDADRHAPEYAFIAGHLGAYTQEYQGDPLTPEEWEPMLPRILPENFDHLLALLPDRRGA